MAKYRKRPVDVEAVQYFYDRPWPEGAIKADDGNYCVLYTANGRVELHNGDWIVTDPNTGDRWPVNSDIFAKTYGPA